MHIIHFWTDEEAQEIADEHTVLSTLLENPNLRNDISRYSAEKYDVLDAKLLIFHNNFLMVHIGKEQAGHAFQTMLKGKALVYYLEYLCSPEDPPYIFRVLVTLIKRNFETDDTFQKATRTGRRATWKRRMLLSEACFDLPVVAQNQDSTAVGSPNRRIQWSLNNPPRDLIFVLLNLAIAQLFAWMDGSFAYNKDPMYYHDTLPAPWRDGVHC